MKRRSLLPLLALALLAACSSSLPTGPDLKRRADVSPPPTSQPPTTANPPGTANPPPRHQHH